MLTIKKEFIQEYQKCLKDPIYFIENYIKITTLDYGVKPFILYPYQKNIIKTLLTHRFVLILQSRQSGKTILMSAYLIWKALFHANTAHCIVANKHDTGKAIMLRVKNIYNNFNDVNLMIKDESRWSKTEIGFNNNSYVLSTATSSNSARGLSLNTLYIDEASFIGQNGNVDEQFLQSVMPTISSGKSSQLILTSSAGAREGFFYNLFEASNKGENEFKVIQVDWTQVPTYSSDPDFKNKMISKIGRAQFEQEFENNFNVNTSINEVSYFDKVKINSFVSKIYKEDEHIKHFYRCEEHFNDQIYVASLDISEGIGKDYSVLSIFRFDIMNQSFNLVGYYKNNQIQPFQLCDVVNQINSIYNFKSIVVERNGIGAAVIQMLMDTYKLENIFKESTQKFHGVSIKMQSKSVGMTNLKEMLENTQKIVVNNTDYIGELLFYTSKGRAKRGFDDTVSTLILLAYAVQTKELELLSSGEEDALVDLDALVIVVR